LKSLYYDARSEKHQIVAKSKTVHIHAMKAYGKMEV